ncbi:MAG: peptidoglycan-associated lipoprotein Pal [Thermodesulfobacteriota bacterium]|nr:peptidoglycan-associated lipoprotein Pal [Thermodesulfobacteriota bacterium]
MKAFRCLLLAMLILSWGLGISCAKKVIHSEATPYTIFRTEPKSVEPRPVVKPEEITKAPSPDQLAAMEREKKLKEEALRKEKLKEEAMREEAARRETWERETILEKINLESIYFDFDQAIIRADQKAVMIKNAELLKANKQVRIRIEGNCDERGTAEYNLALGQKRADAAKDFLEGLGISNKRMLTISYGFERPLEHGHNEATWVKNRRVDFVPTR